MKTSKGEKYIGMMRRIAGGCMGLAMILVSQSAFAEQVIIGDGQTIMAGSGCSLARDSLSVLQNQQGAVIAINFSDLTVIGSSRAACAIRIPVEISAGTRLLLTSGESSGFADLDRSDSLGIVSRLSISGSSIISDNLRIYGPAYQEFGPHLRPGGDNIFRSPKRILTGCIQSATSGFIGLNLAASLMSPSRSSYASITDVAIGVQAVPCH